MRKQSKPSSIAAGPIRRAPAPPPPQKENGQRNQLGGKHVALGQSYNGQILPWRPQNNVDPQAKNIGGPNGPRSPR